MRRRKRNTNSKGLCDLQNIYKENLRLEKVALTSVARICHFFNLCCLKLNTRQLNEFINIYIERKVNWKSFDPQTGFHPLAYKMCSAEKLQVSKTTYKLKHYFVLKKINLLIFHMHPPQGVFTFCDLVIPLSSLSYIHETTEVLWLHVSFYLKKYPLELVTIAASLKVVFHSYKHTRTCQLTQRFRWVRFLDLTLLSCGTCKIPLNSHKNDTTG